ncbi:MAG: hypothetical protein NG747_13355 [Candidatus Brocadia sp.]|nr:hypothetical protein [Candidatus Brocadia sp.]
MEKKYLIGGKTYVQKALVLGQWRQLLDVMKGITVSQGIDTAGIISALNDKLPSALAIVLTEEGKSLRGKDIVALADEIEYEISPEIIFQVAEDFLDCNPLASLMERLAGIMTGMMTGSKQPQSSSPAATSPNVTTSSGAIHQESASPGSNTEAGK